MISYITEKIDVEVDELSGLLILKIPCRVTYLQPFEESKLIENNIFIFLFGHIFINVLAF